MLLIWQRYVFLKHSYDCSKFLFSLPLRKPPFCWSVHFFRVALVREGCQFELKDVLSLIYGFPVRRKFSVSGIEI